MKKNIFKNICSQESHERERERERERVKPDVTLINLHFFYIIDF